MSEVEIKAGQVWKGLFEGSRVKVIQVKTPSSPFTDHTQVVVYVKDGAEEPIEKPAPVFRKFYTPVL